MFAIMAASFCFGVAFKTISDEHKATARKRATSIGGIFFKCKDPKKVKAWYKDHLGLSTNDYGCVFEWYQGADSTKKGFTQWSPFKETTNYFAPSTKEFMINYRVENLDLLLEDFKKEGVTICDSVEKAEYGKFVHILDCEGNKVELWEPNDIEFEKLGAKMGATTTK